MGERGWLIRWKWGLTSALPLALALLLGQAHAAALPELSVDQQHILQTTSEEKPYDVRRHFLRSNERRHDLFFSALGRLGGGYLGVGADQNYTLAAVAQAELVFLVDIDAEVIRWHKIYAALIPLAESSQALGKLFHPRAEATVRHALETRWGSESVELWQSYRVYRGMISAHLGRERQISRNGRAATWLSDPVLYGRIRELMTARRVIARVGDLHGERTLLGIGQAARSLQVTMRTIYLSNVEQWFRYSPQFRRNLVQLPHDGRTVVLRTLARGDVPAPPEDRWHFSVQTLDEFIARIDSPVRRLRRVQDLIPDMSRAHRPGVRGLSWLGQVPDPMPRPWSELPPLRGFP
ncbi:MAG: hypothetical protein JNM83_05685 [Myxococcales bacterium]|nr:hypothetical protein [Myxococcales bacterium]